jgi:hypothetical protein
VSSAGGACLRYPGAWTRAVGACAAGFVVVDVQVGDGDSATWGSDDLVETADTDVNGSAVVSATSGLSDVFTGSRGKAISVPVTSPRVIEMTYGGCSNLSLRWLRPVEPSYGYLPTTPKVPSQLSLKRQQ